MDTSALTDSASASFARSSRLVRYLAIAYLGLVAYASLYPFSGWLAPVLGRVVGGPLREGLPRTLASLKRLAESREETAPMALDPTA